MNDNYMKTILSGVKEWTENLTDDAKDKANNALDKANKSIDKALFVVNITTTDGVTFSADKTFEEITQAYNEGKYNIVAHIESGVIVYTIPFYGTPPGTVLFSGIVEGAFVVLGIAANNEIQVEMTPLATATSKLPNPYPLTFTGAVNETYDGSSAKTIEIPIGADGITPTIGDNGNWYLGNTDTNKPSRGEKGETGARGEKGDTGAQGPQGEMGPQGPRGEKGDKGDAFIYSDFTAEQLAALKGEKGDTGAQGPKGDKGDTGPQGDVGPKGDTGATGATGANGYTPVRGTDYWTAADQEQIVSDVLAALPNAQGVSF